MPDDSSNLPTFGTVSKIIELLEPLRLADRDHVLRTVATWFRIGVAQQGVDQAKPTLAASPKPSATSLVDEEKFSDRPVISAKQFMLEKDPLTEVERLACLAFYLTHYLETPHFKTVDLSRLNTEAAQRKLSNPAVAASNATRDGFFVHAPKDGYRQISAMGERFVQLLPNREAALQVKQRMSSRRGKRSASSKDDSKAFESTERELEEA